MNFLHQLASLRTTLIIACLALVMPEHRCAAGQDWKARFLAEAPQAWQQLEKAVGGWEGSIDQTFESFELAEIPGTGRPTERRNIRYWLNDQVGGIKFELMGIPDDCGRCLFGFNPEYGFELARHESAKDYQIASFYPNSQDQGDLAKSKEISLMCHLLVAQYVFNTRMPDLITGEAGHLKSATPVNTNGKLHVRLDFDFDFDDVEITRKGKPYPGWAIVDPDFHWAVVSYEQLDRAGGTKGTVEYQPQISKVPFPKRIVKEDFVPDGRVYARHTMVFDAPQPCHMPEKDFTLDAYDLPLPGTLAPVTKRSWCTFALANAGIFIAAGILFAVLYRRQGRRA